MIILRRDIINSTRKLLETINNLSKVAGFKINLERSLTFLYHHKHIEKEIVATFLVITVSKKINYLGIN